MPELGIDRMVTADDMARDSRVVELPPKAAELTLRDLHGFCFDVCFVCSARKTHG